MFLFNYQELQKLSDRESTEYLIEEISLLRICIKDKTTI